MSQVRWTATVGALALLSACAAAGPAPIEGVGGRSAGPGAALDRSAQARAPRPHPVTPAPDWAEGPGVPLSTWALQPEEAQPFDPAALPKAHAVAAGDTLFAISTRYQTPLRALIEVNRLAPPYLLSEGQVLTLPKPRFHRIVAGESLVRIADRYGVDPRSLALLNRLARPYTLRPGESLVLPGLARDTAAPVARAGTAAKPAPAAAKPSAPAPPSPPPATAKPGFALAWPVEGKILVGFGPQPGGRRSDGVDIAAPPGPIRAAADGQVVYAGADLPAYGNLMLIQHPGGWVTAYAQAERLTRRTGDKVRKGDPIAVAGPAPAGGAARVHFQIRRGAAPTDPVQTLGPLAPA